jgi:hypothetical protein
MLTCQCCPPPSARDGLGRRRHGKFTAVVMALISAAISLASCGPQGPTSLNAARTAPGGSLTIAWSRGAAPGYTVSSAEYDPRARLVFEFSQGSVDPLTSADSASEVQALQPSSGRPVWSLQTGDQQPGAVYDDGPLLVVTTAQSLGDWDLWILQRATGSEVRSIDLAPAEQIAGLADGMMIISSNHTVSAVRPATAQTAWSRDFPHDCTVTQAVASSSTIGVLQQCGSSISLTDLRPATGRPGWEHSVGLASPSSGFSLAVAAGLFAVTSAGSFSVYSGTGQPIYTALTEADDGGSSYIWPMGSRLIVAYDNPVRDLVVQSVVVATGATTTLLTGPYSLLTAAESASSLYLEVQLPQPLLPVALLTVNVVTGRSAAAALPFAYGTAAITETTGQLLVVSPDQRSLTSYIVAPPSRARNASAGVRGAAPGGWPKACSLLGLAAVDEASGARYNIAEPTELRDSGLPAASSCVYVPSTRGPLISIDVCWDAGSTSLARALAVSAAFATRAPIHADRIAVYLSVATNTAFLLDDTLIVEVQATGDTDIARTAVAIARHLLGADRDGG